MVDITSKPAPSHMHGSTTAGMLKRRETGGKPEVVRVRASQEKYRKALRHGVTHKRFMPDINQSVEWPNDTFTHRRLREGSVVLDEGPVAGHEPGPAMKKPQARRPEPAAEPKT